MKAGSPGHVIYGDVESVVRGEIPLSDETIEDDIDIEGIIKVCQKVSVYFRDQQSCPFNRGNWLIDFFRSYEDVMPCFSFKLPKEMTREQIDKWVKPLMDKYKNNRKYN